MLTVEYAGINSFLVGMANILLEQGIERKTRGKICWELPEPTIIKITNPLSRWVTLSERRWNIVLPYAESLWIALGRNDLEMITYYLSRMESFSDDGKFIRGGYGPRFRCYNGNASDYKNNGKSGGAKLANLEVDQFQYIIEKFKQDPYTRQGVVTIGDPVKDCFGANGVIKQTKDFPCTRTLQFMREPQTNKLNMTVYMRSNDFIWGASAVNIFNYTFMQEYFASILGLEVGAYYHIANNIHYYEEHRELVERLSSIKNVSDDFYLYSKGFKSLSEFDAQLNKLGCWEQRIRQGDISHLEGFNDDFFNDWAKVIYHKVNKVPVNFTNPILNNIINK
jgi:thymidylate synthase